MIPPPGLIEVLEERTGVAPDRLRQMSVAGWVPWLLDDTGPVPDGFETYARQLSVLCLAGNRKTRIVSSWRPWLTDQMSPRACPECVAAKPSPQPYQLLWEIPIVSSCPAHGCWLEATNAGRGYFDIWEFTRPTPRPAPTQVLVLDQRTVDAFILGYVELPRRKVHAGIWFRFLRTIIDELSRPLSDNRPSDAETIRRIWKEAGYRCRDGQSLWRPYEQQPETVQQHTMEASATAIALLENGSITGRGTSAHLLQPEPTRSISDGTLPGTLKGTTGGRKQPTLAELWKQATDSLNTALEAAREDPEVAKQLYDFALYGCRSEVSVRRLRETFTELEIPLNFLSYAVDGRPFV